MPEKQKSKFSFKHLFSNAASGVKNRYDRVDNALDGFPSVALIFAVIFSGVLGLYKGGKYLLTTEQRQKDAITANRIEQKDLEERYSLVDAHTIQLQTYDFICKVNFDVRLIDIRSFVKGQKTSASRIFTFEEFNNFDLIQKIREAGLRIANNINDMHNSVPNNDSVRKREDYLDLIDDAKTFLRTYRVLNELSDKRHSNSLLEPVTYKYDTEAGDDITQHTALKPNLRLA